jgi:hypothetical protein
VLYADAYGVQRPLLGGAAAVPATAAARPASEAETIQKPERQTELLQRNGDTRTA